MRRFADPEGDFLTYAQLRSTLHPVPAEQSLVVPRDVRITTKGDESIARVERRFAEGM